MVVPGCIDGLLPSTAAAADILTVGVQVSATTPPVALVAQERLGRNFGHGCWLLAWLWRNKKLQVVVVVVFFNRPRGWGW